MCVAKRPYTAIQRPGQTPFKDVLSLKKEGNSMNEIALDMKVSDKYRYF